MITASGLTKVFRRGRLVVRAVDGVNLTLQQGEIFGLAGPSGSGKTTLGLMLCGVIQPTAGTVSLAEPDRPLRSQLVFQDPREGLNPRMRIRAIIAEPLVVTGVPRRDIETRVRQVMQQVHLDEALLDRHPHALSGGQRQRVSIARAVIARPDFVVADEPTAMLDPTAAAGIIRLLAEINHVESAALFLISHDVAQVAGVCHRLGVMHAGRMVEVGPPERIVRRPRSETAAALVRAARLRERALLG